MLKLFLLIPFITLEVVAVLGLVYCAIFINPAAGLFTIFVGVVVILVVLTIEEHYGKDVNNGQS